MPSLRSFMVLSKGDHTGRRVWPPSGDHSENTNCKAKKEGYENVKNTSHVLPCSNVYSGPALENRLVENRKAFTRAQKEIRRKMLMEASAATAAVRPLNFCSCKAPIVFKHFSRRAERTVSTAVGTGRAFRVGTRRSRCRSAWALRFTRRHGERSSSAKASEATSPR